MAALAGRKMRVKYDSGVGAAVIAGARTDGLTINREYIDITDKDDVAERTLLGDELASISVSVSCEGVVKNGTLIALAMDPTPPSAHYDFEVEVTGIGTFTGAWGITSFEVTGSDGAEATTFSMTLESSGTITFTAA